MEEQGTVQFLLTELIKILAPLDEAVKKEPVPDGLKELSRNAGLDLEDIFADLSKLKNVASSIESAYKSLAALDLSKIKDIRDLARLRTLISAANQTFTALEQLKSLPVKLDYPDQEFAKQVGQRLSEYLISDYLKKNQSGFYAFLVFTGIVEESLPSSESELLTYNRLFTVHYDRLSNLISNPKSLFEKLYQWGLDTFDPYFMLNNLQKLMWQMKIPAYFNLSDFDAAAILGGNNGEDTYQLNVPLLTITEDSASTQLGIRVRPLLTGNMGVAITPYGMGKIATKIPLADHWQFTLDSSINSEIDYALTINPRNLGVVNLSEGGTITNGYANFRIERTSPKDERMTLLNIAGGLRLEIGSIGLISGFIMEKEPELFLELPVQDGLLVIDAGNGDGFIQKILPKEPMKLDFNITPGFSRRKGFYLKGGSGEGSNDKKLVYTHQLNKQFGPLMIDSVTFKLNTGDKKISLLGAATGKIVIGPITGVVEDIGLEAVVELEKPGLLGKADLDLKFKPPSGAGLSINSQIISGGGYLKVEDGLYTGILNLSVKKQVSITAIAILNTKLPDGTKTFALKMFGMGEFPAIQLGMGFFLKGLGVAVAIECCMDTEKLGASVFNGSLSSLLFPADPIKNAPKIISDLQGFFPVNPGYHAFGVMAKLGWGGAKALVQGELGVFLEIGGPGRIALAGIISVQLPDPDSEENVLVLRMQSIGILDFGKRMLAINASLKGSRLMSWPLDGEMALRTNWGDQPRFALSIGGFYPGYMEPEGFPKLQRLSLTIGSDNPKVALFSYFAITESSLQFGAKFVFHLEEDTWLGLLALDGDTGFDVLIEFDPFCFKTQVYLRLSLKCDGDYVFGIDMDLSLTGPNNYHAIGKAKFEFLGFEHSIPVNKRFGELKPINQAKPMISPVQLLQVELKKEVNWSIQPLNNGGHMIMRDGEDTTQFADPNSRIKFSQSVIPLDYKLEKYGQALIPQGENYLSLKLNQSQEVEAAFAPGQYVLLSDQEKISAPPFEKLKSGFEFGSKFISLPPEQYCLGKEITYETKIQKQETVRNRYEMTRTFPVRSIVMEDEILTAGKEWHNSGALKTFKIRDSRIKVKEQQFVSVSGQAAKGKFHSSNGSKPLNYAKTREFLRNGQWPETTQEIVPANKANR